VAMKLVVVVVAVAVKEAVDSFLFLSSNLTEKLLDLDQIH
jgi:hypothetical protein